MLRGIDLEPLAFNKFSDLKDLEFIPSKLPVPEISGNLGIKVGHWVTTVIVLSV
jgi:hypothetical protein